MRLLTFVLAFLIINITLVGNLSAKNLPIEIFGKKGFDFVLPNYQPTASERGMSIEFSAAPGEYEPISIGLHASGSVSNIRARIDRLSLSTNSGIQIPESSIDLRVVKVWDQAGETDYYRTPTHTNYNPKYDKPRLVPELLVYDDEQDFYALPLTTMSLERRSGSSDSSYSVFDPRDISSHDKTRPLYLPTQYNNKSLTQNSGTIEFWFKPSWYYKQSSKTHLVFSMKEHASAGGLGLVNLSYSGGAYTELLVRSQNGGEYRSFGKVRWAKDKWYRIVLTWGPTPERIRCWISKGTFSLKLSSNGVNPFPARFPDIFSLGYLKEPVFDSLGQLSDVRLYYGNGTFDRISLYSNTVSGGVTNNSNLIYTMNFDWEEARNGRYFQGRTQVLAKLHGLPDSTKFILPILAPKSNFNLSMRANTSRQLWLTVNVLQNAIPGVYSGEIILEAAGYVAKRIPVTLTVLDLQLTKPDKHYGIYYDHSINDDTHLADMQNHGLNSIRFPIDEGWHWGNYSTLNNELSTVREYFSDEKSAIIVAGPGRYKVSAPLRIDNYNQKNDTCIDHVVSKASQLGYNYTFIAGVDEPNHGEDTKLHIARSNLIHRRNGAKVSTAISYEMQQRLLKAYDSLYSQSNPLFDSGLFSKLIFRDDGITNEALDAPIYPVHLLKHTAEQALELAPDKVNTWKTFFNNKWWANWGDASRMHRRCGYNFQTQDLLYYPDKKGKRDLLYWTIGSETPNFNRLVAGFYLFACKFEGAFPYMYLWSSEQFREEYLDPFNDFDNRDRPPASGSTRRRPAMRDLGPVYPVRNGIIPTVQWEAYREGIDDARYLATFENSLRELERLDVSGLYRTFIAGRKAKLKNTILGYSYLEPYKYGELKGRFHTDRGRIVRWIGQIMDAIENLR